MRKNVEYEETDINEICDFYKKIWKKTVLSPYVNGSGDVFVIQYIWYHF